MGGLWGADGVLCTAAEFETKAENCRIAMVNGEVQKKDLEVGTGGYNLGKDSEKKILKCLSTSNPPLPTIHLPLTPWTSTSLSQNTRSSCTWTCKHSTRRMLCSVGKTRQ